jgi:outer membrane murein-binding lipoprotein Lpp
MVSGVYTCVSNRNIAREEADVVRRELIPRISALSSSGTSLESEITTLNTTATNLNAQTSSLESRLAALINLVNNVNGELAQANSDISLSSYQVTNLGRGPTAEAFGRTDAECASLSRMACPDGYMMWSYEARFPGTDNTCRIMCRRLLP